MRVQVIKQDSELHNRILKAEQVLEELGIQISYSSCNEGIIITDSRTGINFRCSDPEFIFPRSCETQFIVR